MTGPLYMFGAFGHGASLFVALIIGVFFGFVLERAGFADSRTLTNIFYFRDMRVLEGYVLRNEYRHGGADRTELGGVV